MSTPVSELVAVDVLSTVATVLVANGYNCDLTAQRHTRAGDKREHLNAIIVQDDPREVSDPKVYNTYEWILPFSIGVYVIPLEDDSTPIDTYCNQIIADVSKALMVDRYRSGNALDTVIRASHTVTDEGLQWDIAVINVEVNYRTSELDPYVNAR
jgi:hypothetical protein